MLLQIKALRRNSFQRFFYVGIVRIEYAEMMELFPVDFRRKSMRKIKGQNWSNRLLEF